MCKNGVCYDGRWKDDMRHGTGALRRPSGPARAGAAGLSALLTRAVVVGRDVQVREQGRVQWEVGAEPQARRGLLRFPQRQPLQRRVALRPRLRPWRLRLCQRRPVLPSPCAPRAPRPPLPPRRRERAGRGGRRGAGRPTRGGAAGRYDGEWRDDRAHGEGRYEYRAGDAYAGAWVKGKKSGRGEFSFAGGDIYRGTFSPTYRRAPPGRPAQGQARRGAEAWAGARAGRGVCGR
jgi:hypothetical protein